MGQCNDAYGAIKVAVALAQAFDCGVNELPLSMVLSWYEQKAVCDPADTSAPWNQKYLSRTVSPGISVSQCAAVSGRKLPDQPIGDPKEDDGEDAGIMDSRVKSQKSDRNLFAGRFLAMNL